MSRVLRLGLLWLPLTATVLLAAATPLSASQGVSIDSTDIRIDDTLFSGSSYRLPDVRVSNPGDEPTEYRMVVALIAGSGSTPVPTDWVTFTPVSFTLEPGLGRPVKMSLHIPSGSRPGDYGAVIAAQVITEHHADGSAAASVGAAAGTKLSLRVESASLLQGWWLAASGFAADRMPWTIVVPAVVVIGATLLFVAVRFRFRIERR